MFTAALGAPETILLAGLGGLLVGSFLNVVIHRVPLMLEREWALQSAPPPSEATSTSPDPSTPNATTSVGPSVRRTSTGGPPPVAATARMPGTQ